MEIPKKDVGDVLTMKKQHPCGGNTFRVLRVGSDIRIVCENCGHDVTVARVKLEKNIKKIKKAEECHNA